MSFKRSVAVVLIVGGVSAFSGLPAGAASQSLYTRMSGSQEVPGPGSPGGVGQAEVTVDTTAHSVCVAYQFAGLSAPATAAHIHKAPAGVAGPVVVPFPTPPSSTLGHGRFCVTADSALVDGLAANPAGFYINVHSSAFPRGEARGQLAKLP